MTDLEKFKRAIKSWNLDRHIQVVMHLNPAPKEFTEEEALKMYQRSFVRSLIDLAATDSRFQDIFTYAATDVLVGTLIDPALFEKDPNFVATPVEKEIVACAKAMTELTATAEIR